MNKAVLSEGVKRFDADISQLQLLGGFSNNVFVCNRNGEEFILKFYPSSEYKKDSIAAELDWIRFLHRSGVNVTAPLTSINENFIEIIKTDKEEECNVLAFEKAKGTFINISDTESWNEKFFHQWGKTLGKIHSLSKSYKLIDETVHKQDWNMGLLFSKSLDDVDKVVVSKWEDFIAELNQLPKDINGYGMIHNDLHHKNFYVHNGEINLFDFGDCEYNWFVYDIAIVLYHAVQSNDSNDIQERENFALLFMKSFLQGYFTENNLERYWLSKLPFFLNYRQIFSYIYFEKFLDSEYKNNEKVQLILRDMRENIQNDTPYLNIQYKDIAQLQ